MRSPAAVTDGMPAQATSYFQSCSPVCGVVGGQPVARLEQHGVLAILAADCGRRNPIRLVGPGDAPARLAGRRVDAGSERISLVFDLHDDRIADDQRRAGHADIVARLRIIERQAAIPEQVAFQVEADEIVRRVERKDPLAIAGGGRSGVGTGRVMIGPAGCPELPLPKLLAARGVEAEHVQLVFFDRAGAGRHHHAIADDNRTAHPPAGQRRLSRRRFPSG